MPSLLAVCGLSYLGSTDLGSFLVGLYVTADNWW
jgi:hypothetical protein